MNGTEFHNLLYEMPDGTLKMTNPLSGHTAWWVPGRNSRPVRETAPNIIVHTELHEPENYCAFCPANILETPPEIERRVRTEFGYQTILRLLPGHIHDTQYAFRRVANLYEIVTLNYWQHNYDYRGRKYQRDWQEAYKHDPQGREHLIELIRIKHENLRAGGEDIPNTTEEEMLAQADNFFLGCHQLIICARHYQTGAKIGNDTTLQGSGTLTPDEHFEYFRFIAEGIRDIYACNRYVRYVVTFQNWLTPAGASVDHLHTQLVGLDDWGTTISQEAKASQKDSNLYNTWVVNYASYNNLVIAENEHAVMFADFGHRNPTVAIYSKSRTLQPFDLSPEQLRGMSDLVHACHAAQGTEMSCNEEWYYQPRDCLEKIPFHVLIKWRITNPAGFEGGTRIFVIPMRPVDVRDEVVPQLFRLRAEGKIASNILIAEECPVEPNSLEYNR